MIAGVTTTQEPPPRSYGRTIGPALPRIRRYLLGRRRSATCRVLLVAGWYRYMPIGDSVIATQHVPFFSQLADTVEVTVWTGTPALWTWLHPEIRAIAPPTQIAVDEFDVAVFETTLAPPWIAEQLAAAGVVVLSWQAGGDRVDVRLGRRAVWSTPLPRLLNRTCRIPEVYRRLGFRSARVRPSRPRPEGAPVIYVNPYASRSKKSMSPRFLSGLLEALARELGDAVRIVVPAKPRAVRRTDRAAWNALGAIVDGCVRQGGVAVAPRGGLDQYCDDIAASALVVGCDTSSQHLAHAIGRPSITCYPPAVGRHLHFFWGPIREEALHFDIPPDRRTRDQRSLAALVARLGARLIGLDAPVRTRRPPIALDVSLVAARFVEQCLDYLTGRRRGRHALSASLRRLHRGLPPEWADHVTAELRRIYTDLPAVRSRTAADRRMARGRLRHLNAPRVARVLVGL
jgi:hypothetical protein